MNERERYWALWKKLEPLQNRYIYQRDYFFCLVGAAITLLFVYMSMRHESYGFTWRELAEIVIVSGLFYGFYYWFESILTHDCGKIRRTSFELDEIMREIETRSYTEGYRDGVSAANSDSVDPEYM